MPDMKTALESAGFKGQSPMRHPARGQKRRGGSKGDSIAQTKKNLESAFGNNYTRLILDFEKQEYNELVTKTKAYVESNARNITTSQLRNIFGKVLRAKEPFDAYQLRPKLAYVAGRADKWQMKELIFLFDELICEIKNKKQLDNFKFFFESIIAYHRYFNPKGH